MLIIVGRGSLRIIIRINRRMFRKAGDKSIRFRLWYNINTRWINMFVTPLKPKGVSFERPLITDYHRLVSVSNRLPLSPVSRITMIG